VSSGQTRTLTTTPAGIIGDFVWRADGRAVRAIESAVVPSQSGGSHNDGSPQPGPPISVVEIDLNGSERSLRNISAEFPWATDARMISDRVAMVGDGHVRIVSVPIEGEARQVPIPIADAGVRIADSGHSGDGNWAFGKIITKNPETDLLIMSTTGGSTRRVHLPVESGNNGAAIHSDGQHMIVIGRKPAETALTIFLVPFDGSAPREFGGIPGHLSRYYGGTLSPDGKLLAFTTEGAHTSTFSEIDFGPALQAIGKR
jgi:hypothetical protein